MKNILKATIMMLVLLGGTARAQGKLAQLDIHTNAVCNDCKHRIETEVLYEKGVQKVTVDLDKEIIHVEYKAKKTDPDKLRQAVSKIGYLADDVQPDAKARAALPSCCQMTREEHDAAPVPSPTPAPHP